MSYINTITEGIKKRKSGRHKSIVRLIGSALPLPPAKRVHFNLAAWNTCLSSKTPSEIFSDDYLNESLELFESGRCCSQVDNDTACSHKSEIQQLQEELKQLRKQVASILENQINSSRLSKCEESETAVGPPPPPPVPPPPPPPPPPIPDNLLFNTTAPALLKSMTPSSKAANRHARYSTPAPSVDILGEVLKELSSKERPRLRPIQRSPGGRPVRPPRIPQDPSDILTEVLKKRFKACHSSDINDSPERLSCNA